MSTATRYRINRYALLALACLGLGLLVASAGALAAPSGAAMAASFGVIGLIAGFGGSRPGVAVRPARKQAH